MYQLPDNRGKQVCMQTTTVLVTSYLCSFCWLAAWVIHKFQCEGMRTSRIHGMLKGCMDCCAAKDPCKMPKAVVDHNVCWNSAAHWLALPYPLIYNPLIHIWHNSNISNLFLVFRGSNNKLRSSACAYMNSCVAVTLTNLRNAFCGNCVNHSNHHHHLQKLAMNNCRIRRIFVSILRQVPLVRCIKR